MFSYRAQGLLAIGLGALGISCTTPDLATNLRPDGPPDVLAVVVRVDQMSANGGVPDEVATYCKLSDTMDPTFVGLPDFSVDNLCGDTKDMKPNDPVSTQVPEVANADPLNWVARVMFDELLDPNIETLVAPGGGQCTSTTDSCTGHLDQTKPFKLTCAGVDVPYDGYYVPNGNNVSWPVGPNLTIFPVDYTSIATGSECSITINDNVKDKDGNSVPTEERGPFKFKLTPLTITATDPPSGAPEAVDGSFTPTITFNANIDVNSVSASDVTLTDMNNAAVPFTLSASGTTLTLTPNATLTAGTYTVDIPAGATFSDVAGGTLTTSADTSVQFTVS